MKITNKILSIPPYISTSWENILSLTTENNLLVILLADKTIIKIPDLEPMVLKTVFECHVESLEHSSDENNKLSVSMAQLIQQDNELHQMEPIRVAIGSINEVGKTFFEHNPHQADLPPMPQEVLDKIVSITRAITPTDEELVFPAPQENCNCVHCQIGKALMSTRSNPEPAEEVIKIEELSFQQWNIAQSGDKLYAVTNRLDPTEHYNVFLGDPIGCTCGNTKCEHILAVLKS